MKNYRILGWGILACTLIWIINIQGCKQPTGGSSGTENPVNLGPDQGSGENKGQGTEQGAGENKGQGAGQGAGEGQGQGTGQGAGEGQGQGAGQGAGEGQGQGAGQGAGEGQGQGTGQGAGEGQGQGAGQGAGNGNTSPLIPEFADVETLKNYLDSLSENTEQNPYLIKVKGFDLSSTENTGNTLKTLCAALSRYVRLDLKNCLGSQFVSAATSGNGPNRARIVSMVLPDTVTAIDNNGCSGYTALISVEAPKVTNLGYGVFKDSKALNSVVMPELQIIESGASSKPGTFKDCGALVSVSFPKLTAIGDYAFYNCSALAALSFPKVKSIGASAFKGAQSLSTIEVPLVESIENSGFADCTALNRISLGGNPPTLGKNVFANKKPGEGIYVPQAAVEIYKNSGLANWTADLKSKVKGLPN